MRAPAFWWRRAGLASSLLSPIGAAVGAIALSRMGKAGGRVDAPVLCIGNPTVGGAGKTPTAIALLERLKARSATPFALLRGHGGTARMPLRVDPEIHDAGAVGDEALLLARHAATIVAGGARWAGAELAVEAGASHIVMDDGFQNPSLHKDVSVLVVDGMVGVGNGCVTPAGPLRAPLLPQLARADAVLVVGDGAAGAEVAARATAAGCTVLRGRLVPDPAAAAALRGVPLVAFAGIGRPEKFFATLEGEGLTLRARHAFADHHPFRPAEIARLAQDARAQGARLVTTEKDRTRLAGQAFAGQAFAGVLDTIATLPVTLALDDPHALDALADLAEARWQDRRR
ncbi:tetraacyldisaccharide 4'-kinase [Xanthobacter autotrophicus]|uniref:tetraacyldisaccharide 4'-kinase n=1 Tax=Xanthobacter autotrophicus TaxID=280 RepID=UPI0024A793C9|nr:tetraacyldisaccharide 4'-kinase [Xanthobacter autotrophicus]MDI4658226.1 tetraacyldisaccharide 4'-kinase [Xanthobacter autotrophicus]